MRNNKSWPVHGKISGPVVMIGFGSIGKGMVHLLERHFEFDRTRFVVIDPNDAAYHPCDDAVLSLHEMFGKSGVPQKTFHILTEDEIVDGVDELGVLLYGHSRNAYWFGSTLSIAQTRGLVPQQNATGLQVTSAILAGMVWALENPLACIVEVEELDFRRCLEVQKPYLGEVYGVYTDWTPLDDRPGFFPEELDTADPWQFRNVLVS